MNSNILELWEWEYEIGKLLENCELQYENRKYQVNFSKVQCHNKKLFSSKKYRNIIIIIASSWVMSFRNTFQFSTCSPFLPIFLSRFYNSSSLPLLAVLVSPCSRKDSPSKNRLAASLTSSSLASELISNVCCSKQLFIVEIWIDEQNVLYFGCKWPNPIWQVHWNWFS